MNESLGCDNTNKTSLNLHKNFKKSKRKRRRNKGVNYSQLKKKSHKKFHKLTLPDCNLQPQKINYTNKIVMSNWYWSNYKKAIEWQDKHQIAHWKSCAFALQQENKYLLQIINSINPNICPQVPVTNQNLFQKMRKSRKPSRAMNSEKPTSSNSFSNSERDEDEYEFEMSEEMMEFFEQSFKHKMDLKKLKDEMQSKSQEEEVNKIQWNKTKRTEEMQQLYGEGASMIIGMETAVQLSFDKYCDMKSPKYWPNIPLKL